MAPERPLEALAPPGYISTLTRRHPHQVVGLGLLLLNVLMVLLCANLLVHARNDDLASARTEALNDVRLGERALGAILDKASIAVVAVAVQVERQLAHGGGVDASTFWSLIDTQIEQVGEIDRINVFDAQGRQLCGLPAERCQHLDVSDLDLFRQLRDHPDGPVRLFGPLRSRPDGRLGLVLARAMRLPDGQFAGVAAALLPMVWLRPLLDVTDPGPGGSVGLRNAELASILRQPEYVGADAAAAARRVSAALRESIVSSPAEATYIAVTPGDGMERVVAYRKFDRYPLYWFEGRSVDFILTGWRTQVAWTGAFLLLFAAISGLLGRSTINAMQRQVQALRLYNDAPCGYHTLAADGTYLSINATELGWLGCSRDEVVGRLKPSDFYTEAGRAQFAERFAEFLRTGEVNGVEYDLVGRHGQTRRVAVTATIVRDDKGRFLHTSSVFHDITALDEARAQLRVLAQQQGVMLDNELIGIVRLVDRRMVWTNQAMNRIFGYSSSEWRDLPTRALYFDDASHRLVGKELQAALRQGGHYRTHLLMRHKLGHGIWIDVSATRLSADNTEVMLLLADISALKEAEEARVRSIELESQNAQLREVSRLKSEFVANMSHELRTPLNAILGFGQMLKSGRVGPDSPRYASHLEHIVDSGQKLLSLIDQVLDFARAEAGKMVFEPDTVSLPHALYEVVELLQAQAHERQITLQIDVDEGVEAVVTDPLRLRQMLMALTSNAIKYSHLGGKVELRAQLVDAAWWQVTVSDHGIGIASFDLPRLFRPFLQLSAGTTKTHGGTGIGLALVQLLARSQGGRVEVSSTLEEGSTFRIILPREPVKPGEPPAPGAASGTG
ncbi:MAG: hypothetical protein RIQ60_3771 [Pseudomonadota bacterium]|jgi:PAS domain S-box-containing protein